MENIWLEEYKTLRGEILFHMKHERQAIALSGTLTVLILTFFSKVPELLPCQFWGVMLLVILTPLFIVYRTESFAIAKIASYIQHCIESKHDDLNWTRRNIDLSRRKKTNNGIWSIFDIKTAHAIGCYFIVLLIIAWCIPAYFLKQEFLKHTIVIILMSVLSVIYIGNFIVLSRYRKYRSEWVEIWNSEQHHNFSKNNKT